METISAYTLTYKVHRAPVFQITPEGMTEVPGDLTNNLGRLWVEEADRMVNVSTVHDQAVVVLFGNDPYHGIERFLAMTTFPEGAIIQYVPVQETVGEGDDTEVFDIGYALLYLL